MTSDDPADTAKDIASGAKSAADRGVRSFGDSVSSATDRAGELAGTVGDAASDVYQRARDGAASLGDKLPGSAGDAMDAGRRAYNRGNEKLARQIGRQPIEALLLAGAIGYLIGWAANRS